MESVELPGPRRLFGSGVIVLLAFAVFALVTTARISRYCPVQIPIPQFSSAVKVNETRVERGGTPIVVVVIPLARDEAPAEFQQQYLEILLPTTFAICRPFEFRPPPFLASPVNS